MQLGFWCLANCLLLLLLRWFFYVQLPAISLLRAGRGGCCPGQLECGKGGGVHPLEITIRGQRWWGNGEGDGIPERGDLSQGHLLRQGWCAHRSVPRSKVTSSPQTLVVPKLISFLPRSISSTSSKLSSSAPCHPCYDGWGFAPRVCILSLQSDCYVAAVQERWHSTLENMAVFDLTKTRRGQERRPLKLPCIVKYTLCYCKNISCGQRLFVWFIFFVR